MRVRLLVDEDLMDRAIAALAASPDAGAQQDARELRALLDRAPLEPPPRVPDSDDDADEDEDGDHECEVCAGTRDCVECDGTGECLECA